MREVNIFELAKNLENYPVEAYKNASHFGKIQIQHLDQKFELYDDMWMVFTSLLRALLALEKDQNGYSLLDMNCPDSLLYKPSNSQSIKWLHIMRYNSYPIYTVIEEKKFPFFSFIATFLPVGLTFLAYQIEVRNNLNDPLMADKIQSWQEKIDILKELLNANKQALAKEQFFERISSTIAEIKELSTCRPLLIREQIELRFLERIQAAGTLESLQSIENEVISLATDETLKVQLAKCVEAKKRFY